MPLSTQSQWWSNGSCRQATTTTEQVVLLTAGQSILEASALHRELSLRYDLASGDRTFRQSMPRLKDEIGSQFKCLSCKLTPSSFSTAIAQPLFALASTLPHDQGRVQWLPCRCSKGLAFVWKATVSWSFPAWVSKKVGSSPFPARRCTGGRGRRLPVALHHFLATLPGKAQLRWQGSCRHVCDQAWQ